MPIVSSYSCLEEVPFDTALAFVDYLRPTQAHWGGDDAVSWIFRGQADYTWPLIPRSWRDPTASPLAPLAAAFAEFARNGARSAAQAVADRHGLPPTSFDDFAEYVGWVAAEYDAVRHFVTFADELNHPVHGGKKVPSGKTFIRRLATTTDWPDVEPTDAFGIAQHHGIPTRLLDWSRRALIAAFFASQVPSTAAPTRIAVWGLDLRYFSDMRLSHDLRRLLSPRAQDSYLHHQEGLFISQNRGGTYYWRHKSWPSLVDAVESSYLPTLPKPLRLVTLPVSEISALEHLLWRERISLAHLMPTHDNIARVAIKSWATYAGMRVAVTAYGEDDD